MTQFRSLSHSLSACPPTTIEHSSLLFFYSTEWLNFCFWNSHFRCVSLYVKSTIAHDPGICLWGIFSGNFQVFSSKYKAARSWRTLVALQSGNRLFTAVLRRNNGRKCFLWSELMGKWGNEWIKCVWIRINFLKSWKKFKMRKLVFSYKIFLFGIVKNWLKFKK